MSDNQTLAEQSRLFRDLVERAEALTEDDFDALEQIAVEARRLNPLQRDLVLIRIKRSTGTSLTALRQMLRDLSLQADPIDGGAA